MATITPDTTPVIAAIGEIINRPKSPEQALMPVKLMSIRPKLVSGGPIQRSWLAIRETT